MRALLLLPHDATGRTDAEEQTEIAQQQVSRWRKSLKDAVAYHDKLVLARSGGADAYEGSAHRREGRARCRDHPKEKRR
jgi:hypothetical protein